MEGTFGVILMSAVSIHILLIKISQRKCCSLALFLPFRKYDFLYHMDYGALGLSIPRNVCLNTILYTSFEIIKF